MDCAQTEKISLLIDGELPPAEVREVERHLLGCETCQSARADFLLLRSQIADYGSLLDPSASRQALAQVLSRRGAATRDAGTLAGSTRSGLLESFRRLRFNPALATVALLLVAGAIAFVIYHARRNSHDTANFHRRTSKRGKRER